MTTRTKMLASEMSMLLSNKLGRKVELTKFNGVSGQIELEEGSWDLVTFDLDAMTFMYRDHNGWTVTEHCNWWANLALYELSNLGLTGAYLGMFRNSHFVYDASIKSVHRVDFHQDCIEINTLS